MIFTTFFIPAAVINTGGTSGMNGFELIAPDVSFAALELLDSENAVSASGTTSSPLTFVNFAELSPVGTVLLHAAGTAEKASCAGNSSLLSEHKRHTPCCYFA